MGHDLYANNQKMKSFHMGGAWDHLLAQSGAYFTCVYEGPRWYMVHDKRMTTHYHSDDNERRETIDKNYPAIICNCGFQITEEETKVLARIARNYAALQRTLPELTEEERNRPGELPPFSRSIRRDWVDMYEEFAEWAEQSQGFSIH